MKKIRIISTVLFFAAFSVFAQEANDGFKVPLNENFSKSGSAASTAVKAGPSSKSPLAQGVWIETAADAVSLIRNVSDGEKSGYELDNVHFKTKANWWFWGDLNDYFHLDAEIAVLNFDKTLYQANSFGANVPDVSWGDGLQTMAELPFSVIKNGADERGVGAFNKMAFNIESPFIDVRLGYGNLKKNGMTEFTGIYSVIDRWNDVGDGYTELKNGWALRNFGNFTVDALAALSLMKEKYGSYDYVDVKYKDKAELAFTFASLSPEEKLFFYNRTNTNAVSAYMALKPVSALKVEGHLLGTFGSEVDLNGASGAGAGRISWNADTWNVSVKQSVAGCNVNSVWGSDGQNYDDINADTATTQIDLWKDFGTFAAGLDQGITFNDTDNLSDGLMHLRCEPYADINLTKLTGKEITAGVYGIFGIDRLAKDVSADRNLIMTVEEAGIEVKAAGLADHLKSMTFDYAISVNYDDWKNGSGYNRNITYHSIMAEAKITDSFNIHGASIIRDVNGNDPKNVPFAFSLGTSFEKVPVAGHPKLWIHFTYGMNPYEDNNYSVYRKDQAQDDWTHRTYLLNTLDKDISTSHVSVGMIWDL